MFTHLHIFAYLAGGAIVAMIVAGMIGAYLERSQPTEEQQQLLGKVFMAVSGILFIIHCMAIVPLILRFFTHMQGLIGNGEMGMVKFLRQHERTITFVIWGVLASVLLLLLPTVIREEGASLGILLKSRGNRASGR